MVGASGIGNGGGANGECLAGGALFWDDVLGRDRDGVEGFVRGGDGRWGQWLAPVPICDVSAYYADLDCIDIVFVCADIG